MYSYANRIAAVVYFLIIRFNKTFEATQVCNIIRFKWRRGVVVISTAQFHLTKPEIRFCAGSNPTHGVSEIRDGEDL